MNPGRTESVIKGVLQIMKEIRTQDAVGMVLCHDITQIIRGVTKDAAFRKGHIVTEEDIPVLLSLGKDYLYVWENDENTLHENEAAERLHDTTQATRPSPPGGLRPSENDRNPTP